MNEQTEERLQDLLCKQVSEGLSTDEQQQLSELKLNVQSDVDFSSLEMTAAAISVSPIPANEALPDHLKSKILLQADEFFGQQRVADAPKSRGVFPADKPTMSIWGWLGWAAAAVTTIALVFNIYQNNGRRDDRAAAPPMQSRERLMASTGDIVRAEWGPGNVSGLELTGDIVWSDSKQEGYMRFRNLPKNDTGVYTYQLWIFDETQDPKTPIDGGIFDVNADGEIVIPIDAKLRARGAKAFAITMEKPGGVMVSERKQLVSLAPVKPSPV